MLNIRRFVIFWLFSLNISVNSEDFYLDYEDDDVASTAPSIDAAEWTRRLEKDVLFKRKIMDPPYVGKTQPLELNVVFSAIDHLSINETDRTLKISGRYCIMWRDERLSWNPADYNGRRELNVPGFMTWKPTVRILRSLTGVRVHWEADIGHARILIPARYTGNSIPFVIACPDFHATIGCDMDFGEYPYDEHTCNFMLGTADRQNVILKQAMTADLNVINLRHVLTQDTTRQHVSDFIIQNITSEMKHFDGVTIGDTRTPDSMSVAYQTIRFRRHAPYYFHTTLVPLLLFTCLNLMAAVIPKTSHALSLFLFNILMISLFMQNMMDKLPRYYDLLPRFIIYLVIQFSLAAIGFFYIGSREIYRKDEQIPKTNNEIGDCSIKSCLKMMYSIGFIYSAITLTSLIVFII